MSSLKKQLVPAPAESLFYFLLVGIQIGYVGFRVAFHPVEITEFAIGDTDICSIYIPIDLPGHLSMYNLPLSDFVGNKNQLTQWRIFEEENAFLHTKEIKAQGFFEQGRLFH
jgi:hypothetical protein